jgi:hypothetical protein
LLETFLAHATAEYSFDLDAVMSTLAPDPQYHMWGVSGQSGDIGPKGYDEVREHYKKAARLGSLAFTSSLKDRITVDDHCLVHEGDLVTVAPGKMARERGYNVDDDTADYLIRARLAVHVGFDESGRILGEDVYIIPDLEKFEKVDRSELPKAYLDYLERLGSEV